MLPVSSFPREAVIETVVIAADREPMVLEPPSDSIDPDAFNSLVRTTETNSTDGTTTVAFALDGHEVTVRRDETVVVRAVEARPELE